MRIFTMPPAHDWDPEELGDKMSDHLVEMYNSEYKYSLWKAFLYGTAFTAAWFIVGINLSDKFLKYLLF
jgi:hypothetical protein